MLLKQTPTRLADLELNAMQKMALQFLPEEQVRKFAGFDPLLEKELANEAREPEFSIMVKDLFDALHDKNLPKLLRTMQGEEAPLYYAFKKQLMNKKNLTVRESKIVDLLVHNDRLSLITLMEVK